MKEAVEAQSDSGLAAFAAPLRADEGYSREQLVEELKRQQRLTEKVIDALPVSLHVVDRELKIVAWNRNREVGGQGIDRQRVIGHRVVDVFSKMSRERLM